MGDDTIRPIFLLIKLVYARMVAALEQAIGYVFRDLALLDMALTHPSYCIVSGDYSKNYQRLEFLGDRALSMGIASMLYKAFPEESEGLLTVKLIGLVRKDAVAGVARNLQLEQFIKTVSKNNQCIINDSILSDVLEAIIGAIYLDSNALEALEFVARHWDIFHPQLSIKDTKTQLQEWAQKTYKTLPHYITLSVSGPPHSPVFVVQVTVGNYCEVAEGVSKREAQMSAAAKCLDEINSAGDLYSNS